MSLAIPVETIANNTTKFSDQEIWSALIKIEKTLPVDIGLDYFIGSEGRLNIYAKADDKWLGYEDFSLVGTEDLDKYFNNLLSDYREDIAA